jgi:hypothetical protein
MDQDEERDAHEKRDRDTPAPFFTRRQERVPDGIDSSSKPERRQENPMRFFETARATPRPSHLDRAWKQVRVVCRPMEEKATGRVASGGELKDAVSAVTAILAQHFPEGPKGAARAHRQFVRWLGDGMGAQTPGTARWAAAFRDIKRLESNPAKPNYLAEVCPCDGIDFSQIGHDPDLRGRAVARAKAKIWSALSWSTTSDGGLVLSKSGKPIARLTPDHAQRPGDAGAGENKTRYLAYTEAGNDAAAFGALHEGKAFLEHWAMGTSHDRFSPGTHRRRTPRHSFNTSSSAHIAECGVHRHLTSSRPGQLQATSTHLLAHADEESIRDCEDRHRGDGAYGERAMPVLAFRHRTCHRDAAGALRDGDQT